MPKDEYYYLVDVIGVPKEQLIFEGRNCRAINADIDTDTITLPMVFTDENAAFQAAEDYLNEHYQGMWQRWSDIEGPTHKSYQYIWKPVVTGLAPATITKHKWQSTCIV
jgi:hypothetical protein